MNLSFFLLLFGTVLVKLSFIIPLSNGNHIDDLKKEIKEQTDIQAGYLIQYEKLEGDYNNLSSEYLQNITTLKEKKLNLSSQLDEKIELSADLYKNLTILRKEKDELNQTLQDIVFKRKKLDAGIKWLKQDLELLQLRSNAHDDETCLKFTGHLHKSLGRSLINSKEGDPLEAFYYENLLNKLLSENNNWKSEIEELNNQIELKTKMLKSKIQELDLVITSYLTHLEKAEKDSGTLKNATELVLSEIDVLIDEICYEETLIEQNLKIVEDSKLKLSKFSRAETCYKKVEEEVLQMVPKLQGQKHFEWHL